MATSFDPPLRSSSGHDTRMWTQVNNVGCNSHHPTLSTGSTLGGMQHAGAFVLNAAIKKCHS